jgi:GH15 family glucan-1,4-alpha-glucosidase
VRCRDGGGYSEFEVAAGERVPFVLTYHRSGQPEPPMAEPEQAVADTERFWKEWLSRCHYHGEYAPAVRRALVTLKALTYAPTGGIVAAATTSLPEQLGGCRNWDYRFCWLRDATFTLEALLETGYVDEAAAWRDWLLRTVADHPDDLQVMYDLDGARRLPERTLDWLGGYEDSRPVRVGNAAVGQLQLDVWGEVIQGLYLCRQAGVPAAGKSWGLQLGLLDFLAGHWREPDNSLWEVRGPRRHFVHSKVLAWVAFDRAVKAAEQYGLHGPVRQWRTLRDEIHAEVCTKGFDAYRNTFTQFYGSAGVDAALLLIPRVGFLPPDDPRVAGTVAAVQRELCEGGLVVRYRPDVNDNLDGLSGAGGAFLVCSFWLAEALHGIGRRDEARELFERLLRLRNDLGLLSEQYDPVRRRQLGNTPQAFSMVGLVNTARLLGEPLPFSAF